MAVIGESVAAPYPAFRDRAHSGERLARFVLRHAPRPDVVLAVPRGGVLVAGPLAREAVAELRAVVVRKLPIPFSPEAGFGAVAPDGRTVLNDRMVDYAGLDEAQIAEITEAVLQEVRRRQAVFAAGREAAPLTGRRVCVVDDGLATGYTMIAALEMVRADRPEHLTVAVADAPLDSIALVEPHADLLCCLIAQDVGPFAVASYYEDFRDPSDDEVLAALRPAADAP